MNRTSSVAKSKSNSAAYSKINRNFHKNSLSNGKIQNREVKKRGVYVERFSNPFLDDVSETTSKVPAKFRKDEKKLIASVLRDLTKPSWSQSQELEEVQEKKDRSKGTNNKYKLKCKSSFLNKKNKVEDKKSINIVIREDSKSSNTDHKSRFLSLSGTKSSSNGIERIHKEISEGLYETESKAITTHDCEDDNMYIFLVDFIESTLDTYKETNEISLVDSEIQEAMVLKEINEKRKTKPSNHSFNSNVIDLETITYKTSKEKPILTNLDLKFQKKNKVLPKNQRTEIRTGSKKLKKKEFVNNMKLQLGLEVDKSYFQEPQSFFKSLMLNMKNKKRAEKFNHSDMECVFNSRKSVTKNKK